MSPFFKIHFKGVVLELLAPICKREKSGIQSHGFFPLEASLPALDGGVDRLSIKTFLLWSDLLCPLQTQASYLSLPVLPPRQDGDTPGVYLMASQIDFQFLTTKNFVWSSLFLWCHPGWNRVIFWDVSQARTTRGSIHLRRACEHAWVQSWPQQKQWVIKGWTTIKITIRSVTTPVSVIAKEVVQDGLANKKWFLSSSYLGQSFQFIPTDST